MVVNILGDHQLLRGGLWQGLPLVRKRTAIPFPRNYFVLLITTLHAIVQLPVQA